MTVISRLCVLIRLLITWVLFIILLTFIWQTYYWQFPSLYYRLSAVTEDVSFIYCVFCLWITGWLFTWISVCSLLACWLLVAAIVLIYIAWWLGVLTGLERELWVVACDWKLGRHCGASSANVWCKVFIRVIVDWVLLYFFMHVDYLSDWGIEFLYQGLGKILC